MHHVPIIALTAVSRLLRNGGVPALAGILLVALTPPASAQTVHVCFEPADTTVALGDIVTVRVATDGPSADLKGYLVRGTYNPGVLTLQSTLAGSVMNGVVATFIPSGAPPDTLGFDAAVLIGSTRGPGALGYFRFQATTPGICDLVLTQVLMRDSLNQPFTTAFCNGRVRVAAGTPTRHAAWGALKAGHACR